MESTMSDEVENATPTPTPTLMPEADDHEPMVEGDEKPPRGVKVMAVVRWGLLLAAGAVALLSWCSIARPLHGASDDISQQKVKYHCTMHPQIVSDRPGTCPICGMTLTPIAPAMVESSSATTERPIAPGLVPPGTVPIKLALDRVQSIGVRTALVEERETHRALRMNAVVTAAEQGAVQVHVRSAGFVEQISVNQTGIVVASGQHLLSLYSPEIYQAQTELLAASRWGAADAGPGSAVDSARRKLGLLGMSAKDTQRVLEKGEPLRAISVHAPRGGIVMKKNVVMGSHVTPETALYEIQDLSQVYAVANVFQRDLSFVKVGTDGRFVPVTHPELTISVRVDLVYPEVQAESRTTRVRMLLPNQKRMFLPGQYGTVEFATPSRKVLVIPRDALLDTGKSTYVFVVEADGRFVPQMVSLGDDDGDLISVLSGVAVGDRVVSGATFLIDSESRLQASVATSRTGAGEATPPASSVGK